MGLKPIPFQDRPAWIDNEIRALGQKIKQDNYFDEISAACLNGDAQLFVGEKTYVVLRPYQKDGQCNVLLWSAVSKKGDASKSYFSDVLTLANMINAKRLVLITPFPGVVRLARRFGGTATETNEMAKVEIAL